ncbi:major facilitator superfamily domain-containing protein [Phlyctochytrium arcticum]|nr:major facilitator superfamily domain-containing protein [Phlyctochytrium arcticum]
MARFNIGSLLRCRSPRSGEHGPERTPLLETASKKFRLKGEAYGRNIWAFAVLAALINFALSIVGQTFEQALIAMFCEAYYGPDSSSPDILRPQLDGQRDCGISEVLNPAARFSANLVLILVLPSAFVSLLTGHLSDRFGRRPFLILALFGILVDAMAPFLVLYYRLSANYLVASKIIMGLTGGSIAATSLVFSCISDTAPNDRATALGVVGGFARGSLVGGSLLGGWLVKKTDSFIPTFAIGSIAMMIAVGTSILIVPETLAIQDDNDTDEPRPRSNISIARRLWRNIKELTRIVRILPNLIVLSGIICVGIMNSVMFVMPYYALQQFQWKTWENTLFMVEVSTVVAIGSLIIIPQLKKIITNRWNSAAREEATQDVIDNPISVNEILDDSASDTTEYSEEDEDEEVRRRTEAKLGLYQLRIFSFFEFVYIALLSMATSSWMVYAAVIVEGFGAQADILTRSVILDRVPARIVGIVNAMYHTITTLTMLLFIRGTSALYSATSDNYPQAVFFALAGLAGTAFLLNLLARS